MNLHFCFRRPVKLESILALALFLTSSEAVRANEPTVDPFFSPLSSEPSIESNALERPVSPLDLRDDGFEGIVGLSNCSASLVTLEGRESPDQKAWVLTNGHCIQMGSYRYRGMRLPGAQEVLIDVAARRRVRLFGESAQSPVGSLQTQKLVYATMDRTDFAIYELGLTYGEIERRYGVKPLLLATRPAAPGSRIEVRSGYWRRTYACSIDADVETLREGVWTWKDALRYTAQCETVGGTSGSPVVEPSTGKVIGVNNTFSENGTPCSIMNPCEVDSSGTATMVRGRGYGTQTHWLYGCLADQGFELKLDREGCRLPRPASSTVVGALVD